MIANSFLQEYDDILLPEDLQKILHIGRNAVYNYLADGTIKSLRIGKKYRIPKLYLLRKLSSFWNAQNARSSYRTAPDYWNCSTSR